jgi:hypothetical protein
MQLRTGIDDGGWVDQNVKTSTRMTRMKGFTLIEL